MGNPFAPGVVDRDTVTARRHRGLDEIPNRETRSIVDNDRGTLHVRAQRAGHAAHRSRENAGELLKRQELVVPRKLIRPRNARTRQVVVELVPDDPLPRLRKQVVRIRNSAQPVRSYGAALCRVSQKLVAAIVKFHRSLRRIAARGVDIHQQFVVPDRKLRMGVVRKVVLEQLVTRGAEDFDRTVAVHARLDGTHGLDGRSTARITRTVVVVDRPERAL